jgi:hypothetical protein
VVDCSLEDGARQGVLISTTRRLAVHSSQQTKRPLLAITRVGEICIGIVCAEVVLAGTDFGGARRRLAVQFAKLSAEITRRLFGTFSLGGRELSETRAYGATSSGVSSRSIPSSTKRLTRVVILDSGEEAFATLTKFANETALTAASLTATGAFEKASVGWFDFEKNTYNKIEVAEQCKDLSAISDLAIGDDGKASPQNR